MYRYFFLLLLTLYGCHRATPPEAQPPSTDAEEASPRIPEFIQIKAEKTTVKFTVSPSDQPRSNHRIYLLLKADKPVTAEQVMEIAGDIIDAFITHEYYPWLQMRIQTSGEQVVKITCIATGDPSTTQSTNILEMTPYNTEVTIEEP